MPVKCTDWEDFSTIQDTTNWNHYRIQAAIAAMQAQLSSYETMHSIMQRIKEKGINENAVFNTAAVISLAYADALIEELKKGEDNG